MTVAGAGTVRKAQGQECVKFHMVYTVLSGHPLHRRSLGGGRPNGPRPWTVMAVLQKPPPQLVRYLESIAGGGVVRRVAVYLADTPGDCFLLGGVKRARLLVSRWPPGLGNRPQRKT